MRVIVREIFPLLLLQPLVIPHVNGSGYNPPGKPRVTSCRSPEKETFTCWWEPGSDGGLPTVYTLYYRKENSETVYECPDYHTAGENSCFFNKNDTSIWINYNITVVATNALGSISSDPVDVDVVYIVQPHTPENVMVSVMNDKDGPFLRVTWEPPREADTRSGWITLIYELRVKLEGEDEWQEHHAGQQKVFNIFSFRSGGTYLIQVRCKPDQGFWSEWSPIRYIKLPHYVPWERSLWILITVLSALMSLILTWTLHTNRHSMMNCLLPPIPHPKIEGFDDRPLKNSKSKEVFSALMVPGVLPNTSSTQEDFQVECLEVYIPEEQELFMEDSKDLQEHNLRLPSDNDSGHGSCDSYDSHTLLMKKCVAEKEEERLENEGVGLKEPQAVWRGGCVASQTNEGALRSEVADDGENLSVRCPSPHYSYSALDQHSSAHKTLSDILFPHLFSTKEPQGSTHCILDTQTSDCQSCSYVNISNIDCKPTPTVEGPSLSGVYPTEYAALHSISQNPEKILQPCDQDRSHTIEGEDYSKVKAMSNDYMVLLETDGVVNKEAEWSHQSDKDIRGVSESCLNITPAYEKPTVSILIAKPGEETVTLAMNGYVDKAS